MPLHPPPPGSYGLGGVGSLGAGGRGDVYVTGSTGVTWVRGRARLLTRVVVEVCLQCVGGEYPVSIHMR